MGSENERALKKQHRETMAKYNELDLKWRSEKNKIGLLMSYYHHGQSEVGTGWQSTQEEVTKYMKCAEGIYLLYVKTPTGPMPKKKIEVPKDMPKVPQDKYDSCEQQKQNLTNQLGQLNQSLVKTRPYLWEDGTAPK